MPEIPLSDIASNRGFYNITILHAGGNIVKVDIFLYRE